MHLLYAAGVSVLQTYTFYPQLIYVIKTDESKNKLTDIFI